MDTPAYSWFSELGMEDPLISSDEYDIMDFFDEDFCAAATINADEFQSFLSPPEGNSSSSSSSFSAMNVPRTHSTTTMLSSSSVVNESIDHPVAAAITSFTETPATEEVLERPAKQLKRANNNAPIILTFGNPSHVTETNLNAPRQQVGLGTLNHEDEAAAVSEVLMTSSHIGSCASLEEASRNSAAAHLQPKANKKTGRRVRPASQTYDHIIAERKRREQLSQRFMALSAIVPGLKKLDKTSVLGDAITYLKHLKERVKTLEEEATKQTMESVVLVRKSQPFAAKVDGAAGSCDEIRSRTILMDRHAPFLPEIEAKLCDKTVLLRVHGENHKGVLVKLLLEVEKLNLAITNTSIASFGSLAVDVTIIAEVEKEFNMTMQELVRSLQSALHRVGQDD